MSSSSSSSDDPPRPPLPVMFLRDKIVEKIRENRVTLIVGDTGCGKSSQVPQFLLEENMEPIVCTQPRRFAVVAIARMVAEARECEVGGEVGYQIGHSNVSNINSERSRIVFKTAGVLLEQMRDIGLAALKYKVIILDEIHERSVESDLVLACVKQFMLKNNDLRVVLMSATADTKRYKDYFKDLGRGERVEVIAIPNTSRASIFQRKVLYLDQVANLLNINSESLETRYCSGPNPSCADADLNPYVHHLIHKLILHIHESEPDIEKSILVFLPTYKALEKQWILLQPLCSLFKVHVLHRSIDTNEALLAMRVWKCHRKVILATNIAESSVTIPGVAHVIDSCRSLQVFWDPDRKTESAEIVWVSKSQADQRKGRTGRTCDGQIYRLVTTRFYNKLDDHEYPAILRLPLRQQVLMICCAESKVINDPKALLQKVLDPPDPEIVEDALDLLVHINALEKHVSPRVRYWPTFYGRLLDSLHLSFDASVLALKFSEVGLLREGILIGILLDVQPHPILQPFGHQTLSTKYVDNYFEGETNTLLTSKRELALMGNLCAFQFWQRVFKDKHRLEQLKQIIDVDAPKTPDALITKLEEEWCAFHNLVQTALINMSEMYEDILNTMHRFRPDFFARVDPPFYFDPYSFKHTCLLKSELSELVDHMETLTMEDENPDSVLQTRCLTVPYVTPSDFKATSVAEKLQMIVKEIKIQHAQVTQLVLNETVDDIVEPAADASLCKFFVNGSCNRGTQCRFSHSSQARRPICKFYLTLQGCRNGDSCFFSHDRDPCISSIITSKACLQEDRAASVYCFIGLLPASADGHVLILNDKDLHFSANISQHYDPRKIIVAAPHPCSTDSVSLVKDVRVLWTVANPSQLFIGINGKQTVPWTDLRCVLWFADFGENDTIRQQHLLQNFFECLAIRILAEMLYDLRVILTMNNTRFCKLQVERLAREGFFFLSESFPFDESSLGKFSNVSASPRSMQISAPISYVFDLHPPTDLQFGDYSSALYKALHKIAK